MTTTETINAVQMGTRKVDNIIPVYDRLGHGNGYALLYVGQIAKINKKRITVRHVETGIETEFNRSTGFVVGYTFPAKSIVIAPECF